MRTFSLEYWQDGGWYVGRLRENPAVMSQGETLAELQDNIRDAYQALLAAEDPGPVPAGVQTMDIQI